jgi:hypothetical protein
MSVRLLSDDGQLLWCCARADFGTREHSFILAFLVYTTTVGALMSIHTVSFVAYMEDVELLAHVALPHVAECDA